MALEVNKFILEGEEIEFTDSKAREDIDTLDTKVDNNYNTLDNKIDSNYTTLDNKIDSRYNTLDNKIDNEATRLDGRVDTVNNRVTSEATRLDGRIDTVNGRVTSEAARLDTKINTQGVPAGGTTSQILAKSSNNDYATEWVNPPTPASSEIDDSVIALDKTWSSSKIDNIIKDITTNTDNTTTSITIGDLTTQCEISKRGTWCTFVLKSEGFTTSNAADVIIGTIPEDYRPRVASENMILGRDVNVWANGTYYPFIVRVMPNGDIYLRGSDANISMCHYIDNIINWEV